MRLYRALLHLYPRSFRAEYGEPMLAVLADRRAAAPGPGSRAALALETTFDTIGNASRVHADMLAQDLRYSLRTLRRSPAFTLTAVLLTAVGIGATTAAVAVADHVLLRPLPYAEPDRLVRFWQEDKQAGSVSVLSPANYLDLAAGTASLESSAAYWPQYANLVGSGAPVRLEGVLSTGDLFKVLGRHAAIGATFTPANEPESVVVISHRAWATYFAADPGIVGRQITLNGTPHTVMGVMPQDFMFPDRQTEFWAPFRLDATLGPGFDDRTNLFLSTVARLAAGRSLRQADAELDAIAADLERQFPRENARLTMQTVGLRGNLTPLNRTMIAAVAGAAICLLLIATTNLAGLLLSRGLSRQREMAVRAAIGAGRERLIRQMLTESFVVAAIGGVMGALLAIAGTPLLARLVPTTLPLAETPSVDWRFVGVAAAVAMLTAIAFGILPARRAASGSSPDALRESARTGSGRRTEALRSALVVVQVAVSVLLLVGVGLLAQALWRVQSRDPGFDTRGVLTMRTSLPWPKYASAGARVAFYDRVLGEIRTLPGVEHAGYVTGLPMLVPGGIWEVTAEGGAPLGPRENTVGLRFATPDYFEAMGIPLKEGRGIAASDTAAAPFVAVVSESFAARHWPGTSAIGRRFNVAFFDRTVVGVAGDVRVRGLERQSEPQVYLAPAQVPDGGLLSAPPKDLVVRASVPPATLLPAIRQIIARADPEQPISNVRMLDDVLTEQTAPRSTQLRVLGGFAAIAMLLASIGLYGLLAFAVSKRMREIGLRMALGATPIEMIRMIVMRGVILAGAGAAIGAAAAYGGGRSLEALLAGVSPHDPAVYAAAVAITLTLALIGTLLPAIRASRVSPLEATRD
jgi:putative ABC transport system permease protein